MSARLEASEKLRQSDQVTPPYNIKAKRPTNANNVCCFLVKQWLTLGNGVVPRLMTLSL
jgi:hypothetical protein